MDERDQTATDEELEEQGDEATAGLWPPDRLKPVLEALLFAAGDPLPVKRVTEIVEGATSAEVRATLKELATDCLTRGIRVVEVAGGWQLRTGPEHHKFVRKLFKERPFRLTRAAVETMTVVAYKQPATRADVEEVRGVDSGGVLETLVERRLLRILGRKDVPGRPLVYGTTKEFLEMFGLKSLRDLPTLAELGDDLTRMADQSGFTEGPSDGQQVLPLDESETTDDRTTQSDAAEGGEEGGSEEEGYAAGEARALGEGDGAEEGGGTQEGHADDEGRPGAQGLEGDGGQETDLEEGPGTQGATQEDEPGEDGTR